jgi:hypothetical protein
MLNETLSAIQSNKCMILLYNLPRINFLKLFDAAKGNPV